MKTPRAAPAKASKAQVEKQAKAAERFDSQKDAISGAEKPAVGTSSLGGVVGLTVRVEINLPAGGNKETYDAIFKSIRENLIDASA